MVSAFCEGYFDGSKKIKMALKKAKNDFLKFLFKKIFFYCPNVSKTPKILKIRYKLRLFKIVRQQVRFASPYLPKKARQSEARYARSALLLPFLVTKSRTFLKPPFPPFWAIQSKRAAGKTARRNQFCQTNVLAKLLKSDARLDINKWGVC